MTPRARRDPLAIVGVSALLPGADDVEAFWQRLLEGWDALSPAGAENFDLDPATVFSPDRGVSDRLCNLLGGWLHHATDCTGFAVSAEELQRHGRLAQWPLHLAQAALRDAEASAPLDRARCGLLLGAYSWGTSDRSVDLLRELYDPLVEPALARALGREELRLDRCDGPTAPENGLIAGYVPGLLCRALGLGGPRYALDAACATSLYALKLAALHLWAGQADTMVMAAASTIDPLYASLGFAALHALPPDAARSRPLDSRSDGLALGQGGAAFVVRRLSDAVADGQRIHAVIRAIGLASDGRGQHIVTPNAKGQLLACARAYEEAGLTPDAVDYVECHATGTRLGDRSELNVLAQVFAGEERQTPPPVGAVKSNFGHLLTAAGGVGLLKTLLAMQRGTIPRTIAVETPLASDDGRIGAAQILQTPTTWPERTPGRRRAAVNSFGFGGTNAHLILEDAAAASRVAEEVPHAFMAPQEPLAIVGLDVHVGSAVGRESFRRRLAEGRPDARPLPPRRWSGLERRLGGAPEGAWIESLELDALRYRMPPRELAQLNPQQLLMLSVADSALRDAGIAEGDRVAVVVATEVELSAHRMRARWDCVARLAAALETEGLDLPPDARRELETSLRDAFHAQSEPGTFLGYIGNLVASRITALWDFPAPNFTVSAEENGGLQALALADLLLRSGEADAVLVGAVDLSGGAEAVWLRRLLAGAEAAPGLALAPDGGWWPGEGAAALVLQGSEAARAADRRAYARIEALAERPVAPDPDEDAGEAIAATVARTAQAALETSGWTAEGIGLIEAFACGRSNSTGPTAELAELAGLARVYGAGERPCVLGSATAQYGHTGAVSGLLGVVRAALCLSDRVLPGQPEWPGPRALPPGGAGRLVVGGGARPWLRSDGPRRAAVQGLGLDGRSFHLLLSEEAGRAEPRLGLAALPPVPVPVFAGDLDGLLAGLDSLEADPRAPAEIARARLLEAPADGLALVIVARDRETLEREIAQARRTLPAAFAEARDWQSPAGSYCAPQPLGSSAKVAYVFPGIGSVGPGLGSELFALAPEALDEIEAAFEDPAAALSAGLVYPAAFGPVGPERLEAADEALLSDGLAALKTTLIFSVGYARLLSKRLGVVPDFACGHSMGELSMLVAGGAWSLSEEWLQQVLASESVTRRLCGPKQAVRDLWGLEAEAPLVWSSFVLAAEAEAVRAAVVGESQVYLTHLNAPGEVVIAGEEAACRRVAERLGCDALRSSDAMAIHCPPVEGERAALAALLVRPRLAAPGPRFLLSAGDAAAETLPEDPGALAALLVEGMVRPVDFPATVERLYHEGARIFLEVGPGATCSRWVGATLSGRPHLALPVNRRGASDTASLTRLLAAMLAHRAPLDPAAWASILPAPRSPDRMPIQIVLGGHSIAEALDALPRVAALPDRMARAVVPSLGARLPENETRAPAVPLPGRGAPDPAVAALAGLAVETARAHAAFLAGRRQALAEIAALAGLSSELPAASVGVGAAAASPGAIFDEAAVAEFAEGSLARVLGPDYAFADRLPRRVRLPAPPFLALSRVTRIDCRPFELGPASIATEYDVPDPAWHAVEGQVPYLAMDAQGVLLLLSCLGIDRWLDGVCGFRWLDARLTFLGDRPLAGQRIDYEIRIDRFVEHGQTLLFFSDYLGRVDGRPMLRIDDCCAGFFTAEELAQGQGLVDAGRPPRPAPAVRWTSRREALSSDDLLALSDGAFEAVFGSGFPAGPTLRLPPPAMLMLDRVTLIEPNGGRHGRGLLLAEKDLDPEHWYIRAHFLDDRVFAGPCMIEGATQLLQLYLLACGHGGPHARFQPVPGVPLTVKFRGQIPGTPSVFTYRLEIVARGLDPVPYVVADVDLIHDGRVRGRLSGLSLQLVPDGQAARVPARTILDELAMDPVS